MKTMTTAILTSLLLLATVNLETAKAGRPYESDDYGFPVEPYSTYQRRTRPVKSFWTNQRAARNLRHSRDYSRDVYCYSRSTDIPEEQLPHGSCCWFEYCDHFPADTTVEFSIDHDVQFNKLIVHTRTRIMPVFVRFIEQDSLLMPLDTVDKEEVADWGEERLLEFLDTYCK